METGKIKKISVHLRFFCVICVRTCLSSFAQQPLSMDEAVSIALTNHPTARMVALAEQNDAMLQRQAVEFSPIQVKFRQLHVPAGNDRLWSVTQDFGIIPEHFRRAQHYRTVTSVNRAARTLTLDELAWQVKSAYMNAAYCKQRLQVLQEHDHYFEALISVAEIYLSADSITEWVKVSTGTRYAAYQRHMYIAEEELKRAEMRLRQLMYIPDGNIETEPTEPALYQIHPGKAASERFDPVKRLTIDQAQLTEAKSAVALEKSKLYPGIHAGYFVYRPVEGMNSYQGWMAGLSVALWTQPQRARIKQAEINVQTKAFETEYRRFADTQHVETLQSLLNEYFVQISFSRENLLLEARLILAEVENDFSQGRINNYAEAFTKVSNAVAAQLDHLEYINLYNQTALELEYYTQ